MKNKFPHILIMSTKQSMKIKVLVAGVSLLLIILLCVRLYEIFAFQEFIKFIETYFSPDQNIRCQRCVYVRVYSLVATVFIAWVALLILDYRIVVQKLKRLKITNLSMNIKVFIFLALILLMLFALFLRRTNLYAEDGVFECLTMVFCVLASLLILIKLIKEGTKNQKFLIILALVFFIVGMEEISWGQRIFGWSTPKIFGILNYQGETNLHNLFSPIQNPVFAFVFFLLGWIMFNLDLVEDILSRTKLFHQIPPFLPSSEFIIFGVIFYFIGTLFAYDYLVSIRSDEIAEEILSIFFLAYSIELFKTPTN